MTPQETLDIDRRTYLKMASGAVTIPALSSAVGATQDEEAEAGQSSSQSRHTKLDRLDAYLDENDLEAVWFADSDTYAWLLGRSNVIDRSSSTGVAVVGYDGADFTIVVDNDERALVRDEHFENRGADGDSSENGESGTDAESTAETETDEESAAGNSSPLPDVTIETFPWYATSLGEAVAVHSPTPAAADFDVPGLESVSASALRRPLTQEDIDRYRTLSSQTAAAVEGVMRNAESGDTEQQVANALGCALDEYGIDHPVVLVAGGERAPKYRHPVPRDTELGDFVVVSVVGRRLGEYASCTRTVAFDPPEWLEDRHRIATRVDATALGATQAAAQSDETAGDVFEAIRAAYEQAGLPDEWQAHHQGGAAGYASREWVAKPDLETSVTAPMAYAWNPTVQGAKSEGTVLVTADNIEPLTVTDDWPMLDAESYVSDVTVSRPDVLYKNS
ncbi:M24 family metallopeptidase (plasmid) [Haloarcula salina]|uniref:M24 family metallopeptidase n=1 Tax=Haloarcula salina TaxID=1429914 RepID=UPI003C6EBBBB